jgi:hypothetical protein
LPVSFYLCLEHVDNLGAYTASRPETGLLISSVFNSYACKLQRVRAWCPIAVGTNAMPRLKFAVILPALIICLNFPVALWQGHVDAQQPPKHEYPIVSTVAWVYLGLNAPAQLFRVLCEATLPIYRIDHAPPALFGVGAGQLLFFTGVVLLWSGVGLFFDRRRDCQTTPRTGSTVWRTLRTLFLLAFAILLFGGGVFVIRHHPAGNPVGDVLLGILCFGWSVVFAMASAMRHLTALSSSVAQR